MTMSSIAQQIKERLDIVDVISGYLPLRKSGRNYTAFCPFHANTRTPAFYVSPERQSWHCFGACAEGGDIFKFVMKKHGWSFGEALTELAQRAGVTLPDYNSIAEDDPVVDRLSMLLEGAADYFHHLLLHSPSAEFARQYIKGREITDETISLFKLGYAAPAWDSCLNHFQKQGFSREELLDAGLIGYNEEKKHSYDRFRDRLIFPIRNIDGQVVGFGARTLQKEGVPKYINSPQSAVFDKSQQLYALDIAKRPIREARQVVIVEGYMDAIRAHQAGFRNVVAQMGTALTESQLNLLKRYTKRFIIALDADEAGAKATLRSLNVVRDTLDRNGDTRFDELRGLVRHEGRLKSEICVVTMPEGKDPDDAIRANPAHWEAAVATPKPIVQYVIERVVASMDQSDPKGKAAVVQQLLPLINDVADSVERDSYSQLLARMLAIDERILKRYELVNRPKKSENASSAISIHTKPRPSQQLVSSFAAPLDVLHLESNYLCQSLSHIPLIIETDLLLKQLKQPMVSVDDFSATEDQFIWRSVRHYLARHPQQVATIEELCDSLKLDNFLRSRLVRLQQLSMASADQRRLLPQQLARSVLSWRLDKIKSEFTTVKQMIEVAKGENDDEAQEINQYKCMELTTLRLSIEYALRDLPSFAVGDR